MLPNRLLDLSRCKTEKRVHYRRNDVPAGKYVALSYCWGGPQALCLTEETYNQFWETGIALDRLPATFRDAIKVSLTLGVRYL